MIELARLDSGLLVPEWVKHAPAVITPSRTLIVPPVVARRYRPKIHAAKSVTRVASSINTSGGGTATCSFGALPAIGQPVFVLIPIWRGSATPATITGVADNQAGNGAYTRVGTDFTANDASSSVTVGIFFHPKIVASTGTFTVTVTKTTSTDCNPVLIEGGGFGANGAAVDTGTPGNASGTTAWAATNAGANNSVADALSMGVVAVAGGNNNAWSNSSGYTDAGNSPDGTANTPSAGAYKVLAATGAQSITWSRNVAGMAFWASRIAIFIDAAGGGSVVGSNYFRHVAGLGA